MAARSPILTFDEVLTHYIGEFGRGQRQHVAILSLFGVPNGLMFLLWVMVTVDPIKTLHWQCTDPGDLSCSAVHAAPTSHAFCQLPAGSWHWTSTGTLTSFDVAAEPCSCHPHAKAAIALVSMFRVVQHAATASAVALLLQIV